MRGTLHIVSARDYPAFAAAVLPALRRQYAGARLRDVPTAEMDRLAQRATAYAAEPRTNAQMRDHLGGEDAWFRVRFHVPFVFAPPLPKRLSVSADAWLGCEWPQHEEAVAQLARSYLAAFGPATAADAARWARLPVSTIRAALERVRTIDLGDGLLDLSRSPRPGDVSAPPRLLPLFESILLAYDDRSRFLSPEVYDRVMLGGMVLQAVLVDGTVRGAWRLERGKVVVEPFEPFPLRVRRELDDEVRRTEAVLAA